jgi:prolyl 4-hydroxylase
MLFYIFIGVFSFLCIFLIILFLYVLKPNPQQRAKTDYRIGSSKLSYLYPQYLISFVSTNICYQIIHLAIDKGLEESSIGNHTINHDIRSSYTCWLNPNSFPIIQNLYTYITHTLKLKNVVYEDLQVVKYKPNGHYKEHYDQCETTYEFCKKDIERFKGPRMITLIIYLNDTYENGETYFPFLDIKYKGKQGDALLFYNLDKKKKYIHPYSLHQGLPVSNGIKWIANVWIRTF